MTAHHSNPSPWNILERKIWTSRGSREIDWGFWGPMLWTKSENGWQTVHPFNICLCIPPSIGKHLTYLRHCHCTVIIHQGTKSFPRKLPNPPRREETAIARASFCAWMLRLPSVLANPALRHRVSSCFIMFHHCHSMSLLHIIAKSIPTMTKCSLCFPQ